jgi:hypothetical protein
MAARISEEKLCALLLGEAGDSERRALEAVLQGDPASRAALEEFRAAAGIARQALDESGNASAALTGEQRQKVLEAAGLGGTGRKTAAAVAAAAAGDDLDIDVEIEIEPAAPTAGRVADGSDLFSLGNLQSLTREAPAVASARGKAGEEISGLVDLRALTQSREDENPLEISELLHLGHGGSAGIAPVVAPETVERRRNWLIGIGAGLAAVIVIGGLIFVLVRQAGKDAAAEEESDKAVALLMEEIEKLKASGGSEEELEKAEAALADEQARQASRETEGQPVAVAKAEAKTGGGKSKKSGGSGKAAGASAGAGTSPAPAASPRPKGGSVSELDDLLGGGGSKPAKKPAATGGGGVPDKLSREDVQAGMQSVAGAVKACGKGAGGTLTVRVAIAASGSVTSAKATGSHAGTPVGSCAEKAVKRARFPKAKNKLDVSYPFKL